jgi:hypothetical protein
MQSIPKWELFELALSSGVAYDNPFIDVSLDAVFKGNGRVCAVDGFYDGRENGKHIWRIRFAPMCEGEWCFETRSNDPALCTTGLFTCTPPVSRGGLTINPQYANWFAREDGGFQFICNEGWYPHAGNGKQLSFEDVDYPPPAESDWKTYLDILAEHKINFIIDIGQLYARQSTITDPTFRWPWKVTDPGHNKIDKDRFNLDFYQRTDRQLHYAKEKGIFFAMELLYDNSVVRPREWSHHPLNTKNGGWLAGNEFGIGWDVMFDLSNETHVKYTERYVKYTLARYSAFWNICWSVGSENGNLVRINDERLPHAFIPPELPAEWYAYWTDYMNRRDPYGRLKSYGDAGKQDLMVTSTYNNFIITQDPRNYSRDDVSYYYKAMNTFGEEFWKYGRPVVIGEMTAGTNGHYDMERRLFWIGFASGYTMGRADRHFGPVINGKLMEIEKFGTNGIPPIYQDIRRMAEFVESRKLRFWRMRPNDRLLENTGNALIYCLAAEDEEYVIYFVNGGTASLDLPEAEAEWYNPRTGEAILKSIIPSGKVSFNAPDSDDWVLYIKAAHR